MTDFVTLPLLNPRGVYDPTIWYDPNDQITYNGVPYFCRVGIINGQPITPGSDPTVWQLLNEPGTQGAKGDKGDPGVQGPQGRDGITGASGAGYRVRGNWDAATAYSAGDSVAYINSAAQYTVVWFAVKDNTNVVPGSDSTVWAAGIKGDTGDVTPAAAAAAAAALASQNAAAASATSASGSAASALSSKNAAATSQTNAATSETNALASKNAAATSATAAGSSQTAAAGSATAASGSASAASTSQTAAAGSATAAAGSATTASNAATTAVNAAASITRGFANLLPNGSGELGIVGWGTSGPALGTGRDSNGTYFTAAGTGTSGTYVFTSNKIPIGGSIPFTLSGEIFVDPAATGTYYADVLYFDASNVQTFDGGNFGRPGPDGTFKFVSGTDPAASIPATTRFAIVRIVATAATWTTLAWRRMKLEQNTTWSPYSAEATEACLSANPPVGLNLVLSQLVATGIITATGKLNGYNNPNLLVNGSGEFGAYGWAIPTSFGVATDATGAIGTYFGNTGGALASYTNSARSAACAAGAGVAVTASFDVSNSATAGSVNLSFAAFNSAGTFISNIGTLTITNGAGWQRYSISGTTPAATASIYVYMNLSGVTAPAFGVLWRRVKVEQGSTPSLYSQEGSINALYTGALSPVLASLQVNGKVRALQAANILINGSAELGNYGWTSNNFSPIVGGSAEGGMFLNGGALSGSGYYLDGSLPIAIGAGVPLTITAEIYNGSTAGNAYCKVEAYDSTGTFISGVATTQPVTNGNLAAGAPAANGYYQVTGSGSTPASTSYVIVSRVIDTSPNAPANTVRFRRMKLESGSTASLYSTEASDAYANSLNVGVVTGNRNYIVDGAFENFITSPLSQSASVAKSSAVMYIISTGNGGAQTLASSPMTGGGDALGMTTPAGNWLSINQTTASTGTVAANTAPYVTQNIENVDTLNKRSATFSMWLVTASGTITIPSIIARQGFGTGGSPSAQVVFDKSVSWVVTTTPKRFSVRLDFPSTAGKTFGTNGDNSLQLGFWFPPGVTGQLYTAQWQLEQSSPLSSSDLTGNGGAPTPFEYRGQAEERVRVGRYYETSALSTYGYGSVANDVYRNWAINYKIAKRGIPILSVTLSVGTFAPALNGANGFTGNYLANDTTTPVQIVSWISDARY